jgi:predicted anti-sigma-YlaC factor YlaD
MQHIDELTMMMYLDNELSDDERKEVQSHLPSCPLCQAAYSRIEADQALFATTFADSGQLHVPVSLNRLTQVQIEAIASLHKQNRQRDVFLLMRLFGVGIGAVLLYFFLVQNQITEWLVATWSAWQSKVLWTSAFWLRDHAGSFLLSPDANASEIALLFAMLLAALVLLNARHPSAHWSRSEGRKKK